MWTGNKIVKMLILAVTQCTQSFLFGFYTTHYTFILLVTEREPIYIKIQYNCNIIWNSLICVIWYWLFAQLRYILIILVNIVITKIAYDYITVILQLGHKISVNKWLYSWFILQNQYWTCFSASGCCKFELSLIYLTYCMLVWSRWLLYTTVVYISVIHVTHIDVQCTWKRFDLLLGALTIGRQGSRACLAKHRHWTTLFTVLRRDHIPLSFELTILGLFLDWEQRFSTPQDISELTKWRPRQIMTIIGLNPQTSNETGCVWRPDYY